MISEKYGNEHGSMVGRISEIASARMKDLDIALPRHRPPKELEWGDLKIISRLGGGSFSNVFKANVGNLNEEKNVEEIPTKNSSGSKIIEPKTMYALKCLNNETMCCSKMSVQGAIDLATEAKILSSMKHENIITLHAVKGGCISEAFGTYGTSFFFVLDLLEETLEKRIVSWREEEANESRLKKLFASKRKRRIDRLTHRLETAIFGVAKAMEYLHQHNIIHRDLKPQNVGFDEFGVVKIFDFGLAKKVEESSLSSPHETSCSKTGAGGAGTLRYMSPENHLGLKPGLPADVYSFAIMLWEVCTLRHSYDNIKNSSDFKKKVFQEGHRPSLNSIDSAAIRCLLLDCWSANPNVRRTFRAICITLETLLSKDSSLMKESTTTESSSSRRLSSPGKFLRGASARSNNSKKRSSSSSWRAQSVPCYDSRSSFVTCCTEAADSGSIFVVDHSSETGMQRILDTL